MDKYQAITQMIPPSQKRPSIWRQGIIQVWITRACDRACYGCTQGSNLGGKPDMITLDNFEQAVSSLTEYFGVVGIFGGNPAVHPKFPQICEILTKYIPFQQRGLWCNHPKGHGHLMAKTFNPYCSNLNVHESQEAFDEFKRDWPESRPFGLESDSRHSPVFGSMIELGMTEEERWDKIVKCDINKYWSAMIGQFRGEPRAWFCEVAGSQSMLMQNQPCPVCETGCEMCDNTGKYPDTGLKVVKNWWKESIVQFSNQINFHCHRCLVPMKGYGQLANSSTEHEQTTKLYVPIFKPKVIGRKVDVISSVQELGKPLTRSTDYVQNAKS